ncbi:MAG: DUF4856 domain-containing protein [Flavobacteriales bacterium]|nr:DUF4856 domain-containing protein [Flavobacteriales bacterium]
MKKIILPLLALSLLAGCKKDDPVVETTVAADDKEEETSGEETSGEETAGDDTSGDDTAGDDTNTTYDVPTKYEFGGSVSYSGQTDRLDMLEALKAEVSKSHSIGATVDADVLQRMYANTGTKAVETSSGTKMVYEGFDGTVGESTKNLSGKTEANAKLAMEDVLDEVAQYAGQMSENQSAGLIARGEKYILVNDHGQEYAQLVEKGLMGSCFYYQITAKYLSDEKIGSGVDNETKEEGKNYTDKQHHFDEAFGYFGVPTDWDKVQGNGDNPDVRFWGKYCAKRNGDYQTNSIFDDFLAGRAAIDNDVHDNQIQPVENIKSKIEKVAASTAVSYFNSSKTKTDEGDKLHALTEGLCFLRACMYGGPNVSASDVADIEEALNNGNFFTIENTHIDAAVNLLTTAAGL